MEIDKIKEYFSKIESLLSDDNLREIEKLDDDDKSSLVASMIMIYMRGESNLDRYFKEVSRFVSEMISDIIALRGRSDNDFSDILSEFNIIYTEKYKKEFRDSTIDRILGE